MPHKRLFIPGPTEVRPENLLALATPQPAEELDRLMTTLDRIEQQVRHLPIPPAHAESHFHLRLHIDLVRAKVLAARAALR